MGDVGIFYHHNGAGPVHLAQDAPHDQLSWCGVKVQFRHVERPGSADEVTCPKCLRRVGLGHPLSRGGR
jgi:hypothetical protein